MATLKEGKSNPDPNVIVNKFDSLFINRRFLESSQNCLPLQLVALRPKLT